LGFLNERMNNLAINIPIIYTPKSPEMDVTNLDFLLSTLSSLPSESQSIVCMALLDQALDIQFKHRLGALQSGEKVAVAAAAGLRVPSLSISSVAETDCDAETIAETPNLRVPGMAKRSASISSNLSDVTMAESFRYLDSASGQTTRCNSPIPSSPMPVALRLDRLDPVHAPKLENNPRVYFRSIHRLFARLTDKDRVKKQLGMDSSLPAILVGLQLLSTNPALLPINSLIPWDQIMSLDSANMSYLHEHALLHYVVAAVCLGNKFLNDHACNVKYFAAFTGLSCHELCIAERELLRTSQFGTSVAAYMNLLCPISSSPWLHTVQQLFSAHSQLESLAQFRQFASQMALLNLELQQLEQHAKMNPSYIAVKKQEFKNILLDSAEGVYRAL